MAERSLMCLTEWALDLVSRKKTWLGLQTFGCPPFGFLNLNGHEMIFQNIGVKVVEATVRVKRCETSRSG